jgi:hypothetical protein
MTLAMPDSTIVGNLPNGYDAYLGYVDGDFDTAAALRERFPAAELVLLTVTGDTLAATGADVENFDLTPESGARWAKDKLGSDPGSRPVLYASVGSMMPVVIALGAEGIPRASVRLLSAHFGDGPHICGPHSCGLISLEMDGTQWSNQSAGLNGAAIDMSMLAEGFFGEQTETERLVTELGIVRQGMTGAAVKTVQGLCNAREGAPITPLVIDGVFGPATEGQVKGLQQLFRITVDGIVGPNTWPVLLGVV